MSDVKIKLEGESLVISNLGKITSKVLENVDKAIAKSGFLIQGLAQKKAPVDTGALRRTIHVQKKQPLKVEVKTGVNYAKFVEFGTVKSSAQPFMRPALRQAKPKVANLVKEAVKQAIK